MSSDSKSTSSPSRAKAIEYGDFFELHDTGATRPFLIASEEDWLSFERAHLLFQGAWRPPRPVQYKVVKGGFAADFLWTGFPAMFCVSYRVVNLLVSNHLTGWTTYPVEVSGPGGGPLEGYHGFAVRSWAGQRDLSRSPIIVRPPIVPGAKPPQVYLGLYFDEAKWDGSDIFRVEAAVIVVTRRVRDAFRRAKISNVRFTALTDVETSVHVYRVMEKKR